MSAAAPSLSVVMPVLDGRRFLERSLPPLLEGVPDTLLEVLVVDDGSRNGSGEWARQQGARVLCTGGREGPAVARNLGAREARGEVVLFVDADVVIHRDAPEHLKQALRDPEVVAVFGSYDDRPPDPAFASQYMNLRHHHVHQTAREEATTFWAGCGAVRRRDFLAVGGYDGGRFAHPSIEDIELGYRLRARGGRIRIVPEMQGTHLKQWKLWSVIHTDVVRRALPWSRLLLERREAAGDLNASPVERARAALAAALALSVPAAAVGWLPPLLPGLLFLLACGANRRLFCLFRRRRGTGFALAGLLFHQLYYLYSASVYLWCWLERAVGRRRATSGAPS